MKKVKLATVWLDGCSGCHMSLLDMDAGVIALAGKVDIVYGPLVDAQEFPDGVDVTLVEGAVSSMEDMHKIQQIRQRTHLLISLGDCAVTGNVPSMRNSVPVSKLLQRVYVEGADEDKQIPSDRVALADEACPPGARIRRGRLVCARLSSARQGNPRRCHRSAGRPQTRGETEGEVWIRSVP